MKDYCKCENPREVINAGIRTGVCECGKIVSEIQQALEKVDEQVGGALRALGGDTPDTKE